MKRLGAAEHACERLDRGPHDVDQRLLRRQRDARGLGVEAHPHRLLALGAVGVAHLARPDPPRGAVLRDLLEEVDVGVEEEREAGREGVDVEPALERRLDVREPVLEREGELLLRGRARLADVVAGDRDRVPARHPLRAPLDHVGDEPHRRLDRKAPLLLGDVLLQDVGLDRAAQRLRREALLLGGADVEGEQDRRRGVDRHRGGDPIERDAVEEVDHVVEGVDRHPLDAHFAEAAGVVGVEAHQGRHVERRRETGLAVVQQVAEALVRLLGGAEAGELAHRPQPAPVHGRIHAPGVGVLARESDVPLGIGVGEVLPGVEGPHLLPGDGLERRLALVLLGVDLLQPLVGASPGARLDSHAGQSRRAGGLFAPVSVAGRRGPAAPAADGGGATRAGCRWLPPPAWRRRSPAACRAARIASRASPAARRSSPAPGPG